MIPIAYLEPVAAALGDNSRSPRARRPVSDTVLQELDYTADLLQRADVALQDAISRLEGAGVRMIGSASLSASIGLSQLAAHVRLQALLARAGRAS